MMYSMVFLFSIANCVSIPTCIPLDLTHDLDDKIPIHPLFTPLKFRVVQKGPLDDIKWVEYNELTLFEHTGTHIDAPVHFVKGKNTIDEVPLDTLMGEACVLDITDKVDSNPDYAITVKDLIEWESKYGRIPSDGIVLINSGWDKRWGNPKSFLGTNNISQPSTFHFPAFSGEGAEWLIKHRLPRAVGVDTISLDPGQHESSMPAHVAILSFNIPGAENLKNIGMLPARGSTVFFSAMKVKGGSGGPIRAFALGWRGDNDPCRRDAPNIIANALLIVLSITFAIGM